MAALRRRRTEGRQPPQSTPPIRVHHPGGGEKPNSTEEPVGVDRVDFTEGQAGRKRRRVHREHERSELKREEHQRKHFQRRLLERLPQRQADAPSLLRLHTVNLEGHPLLREFHPSGRTLLPQ